MFFKRMPMILMALCICAFGILSMSAQAAGNTAVALEKSVSVNSVYMQDGNAGTDYDKSDSGIVLITNAAAGTGVKLSGARFAVYGHGRKVADAKVIDGKAELALPEGEYYLRQQETPAGYHPETTSISFSILRGKTTVVDITSEQDLANLNPQDIIPKTGERFPGEAYICSILCVIAAAICGMKLRQFEKRHEGMGMI